MPIAFFYSYFAILGVVMVMYGACFQFQVMVFWVVTPCCMICVLCTQQNHIE